MVYSMKTSMPEWMPLSWRLRMISRPVLSPMWQRRR